MHGTVTITSSGRTGDVVYRDAEGTITGWWEFAGGDVLAIVCMGDRSAWERGHSWALDRRPAILRHVAEEVVRQKAGGHGYVVDEASGFIEIR